MNGNSHPDFIAISDFEFPRTIYHIEISNEKTEILWQYTIPKKDKGYFVDMILEDFDNDGIIELIAATYQEDKTDIFYTFLADAMGFYNNSPIITGLQNTSSLINNPRKLYSMSSDKNGQTLFILTQGSPNRRVIICEYLDGEIIARGSIGEKFLNKTIGPIDISMGDFNADGSEDIFILDNGFTPSGYFIYSDGSEVSSALANYPRLKLLNERGIDINFDGSDDLVIINRDGEFMSDIWGSESIELSEEKIQNMMIIVNNGFIYITIISQAGKISNYSIDPLTRNILTSNSELPVLTNDYNRRYALSTSNNIIISQDGNKPEIWMTSLTQELISVTPPPDYIQRIYNREPDYNINLGEKFYHKINWDEDTDFLNFEEEYIPSGMEFDLDQIQLKWKPKKDQLGYHQLSYKLDLRKKGNLEINTDEKRKIVSQTEFEVQKNYSHLIYVNDPIVFKLPKDHLTIVNRKPFEWTLILHDKNADARLNVKINSGNNKAQIKLIAPEIILVSDTIIFQTDTIEVDTAKSFESVNIISEVDTVTIISEVDIDTTTKIKEEIAYLDTVKTEFEEFTEQKREVESDPLKKKKLEKSDEDFKTKEEEYREKLKTHKKILRDGKNVWVPIDSLIQVNDTIITIDTIASIAPLVKELGVILHDTTITEDELIDGALIEDKAPDTLKLETEFESPKEDTNYVEISYRELVSHQAKFSWFPVVKPGEYDFIISASDGITSDTATFTISVHPEIDISMNQTKYNATVDKVFTTHIMIAQEPLSEKFTYKLVNAPENMKIDSSGNVNWVPIPTQVDDYNFEIIISDGIASSILPINVYVNSPPVISSRPPKIFFLPEGEQLNFQLESFDLNNNTNLEWDLITGPPGMSLTSEGLLIWKNSDLGHHPYEIQLSDGIDSVQWKADIYVNATPEITSKPITTVTTGERYEYILTAWDANKMSPYDSLAGNHILFSLVQGPKELNINENDILIWDTKNVPLGEYMVAIGASDGVVDDIQVFPIFINSFPIITSLDSIIFQVGKDLKFQIKANDKNPTDTLTYHLDPLPGNLVMELHNGLLTWTPEKKDLGVNTFRLQVKDGHDVNGTIMPFKIFVYDLPHLTSELSTEAFTNMEYTAFITAKDMNGKKLNTPESIIIDSASFNYYNLSQYAHLFKWTPRDVDKGNHEFIIKLIDNFGFTTYHKHNLTVFSNPCVHCDKEETAPADTTGR